MTAVLSRSLGYGLLIFLGSFLRKRGVFSADDQRILGRISLFITLPAAIMASFRSFVFDGSLLLVVVWGLAVNFLFAGVSMGIMRRQTRTNRAMIFLHTSSFNIGSFVLPYLSGFYPASAIIYSSMFDVGNSLYSMGLNYAIAYQIVNQSVHFDIRAFVKRMLSTIPFVVYLMMISVIYFKIQLPVLFYDSVSLIGNANVVIVMIMFGIMFEPRVLGQEIGSIARVLFLRYGTAVLVALLIWTVFPLEGAAKQVLIFIAFAPMSSVIATFCMQLNISSKEVIGAINSLSVIISIIINTALLAIWLG